MSGLNGTPVNGSAIAASDVSHTLLHHLRSPLADDAPASDDEACATECRRLEREIAAAEERVVAAGLLRSEREEALRAALRQLVIASQDEVAELERQHETSCAEIRRAAQEEVARVRAGGSALPLTSGPHTPGPPMSGEVPGAW